MRYKALIWFTGVISKYTVEQPKIMDIQLNMNTLTNISEEYDMIFIICVRDDNEKEEYRKLLKTLKVTNYQVLFVPYNVIFSNMVADLVEQDQSIIAYIDYSKVRLNEAQKYIINNKCIHVSQLLN